MSPFDIEALKAERDAKRATFERAQAEWIAADTAWRAAATESSGLAGHVMARTAFAGYGLNRKKRTLRFVVDRVGPSPWGGEGAEWVYGTAINAKGEIGVVRRSYKRGELVDLGTLDEFRASLK